MEMYINNYVNKTIAKEINLSKETELGSLFFLFVSICVGIVQCLLNITGRRRWKVKVWYKEP